MDVESGQVDEGADVSGAAPPNDQAPADVGSNDPELSSLLAEFDTAKQSAGQTPTQQPAKAAQVDFDVDSRYLQLAMQSDQQRDLLARLLQHNHDQHLAYEQQERVRLENADFDEVVAEAQDYLEGLPVAEDYAKRWFLAEVQLNPQLRELWEHRRDTPELQRRAVQVLHREMKKMRAQVSKIPDRDATEDRAAVTAAVRGSGKVPPSESSSAYRERVSRMNDREFQRESERLGV